MAMRCSGSCATVSPAKCSWPRACCLPQYDLYIEITTLNQKLVTKKNRKARRLRELHPDVAVKVLYQRDYLHLLVKYGLEPPSQLAVAGAPGDGPPLRLDVERRARTDTASASDTTGNDSAETA